jgi:phytoene synthase
MPAGAQFEILPPLQRLALAYAPRAMRLALLGMLALDVRLADIVRHAHEPMLAQLRLAWWREALAEGSGASAPGDPLLAMLGNWPGDRAALVGLADGWEAMTGPAPLSASAFAALAEARAAAFAALAEGPAEAAIARSMGRAWALSDIAAHLSDPREREAALALVRACDWRRQRLGRKLRPLAVLHGLAARSNLSAHDPGSVRPAALLAAIRIGITGR